MRAWIYLYAAIISEVLGTSSIKLTNQHMPFLGYLIMYAMIGLSYYFLSLAIKKVPVGVAYALWEGIGIVIISLISIHLFGELITPYKAMGLGLIILGILMIKVGTIKKANSKPNLPLNEL